METIAKDKRDLIKTKNGYFKYTLSGIYGTGAVITAGHDCEFRFQLPPLNEMGFSDQYNQCLIQFRSITLGSIALSANGKYGENASWFSAAGAGATLISGIQLVSSIPCRNQHHQSSSNETWTQGGDIFAPTLSQKLSNKVEVIPNISGAAVDTSLNFLGTTENLILGTTPTDTASARFQVNKRNCWSYETDKDIWTGGMLCGIPMGTEVSFKVRSLYNGDNLCLSTAEGHLDGTGTSMCVELEIQLLPNPTPRP